MKIADTVRKFKPIHLRPSQTIMMGFALMILIGALLLNLPIASKSGESIGFINALFTATSANCVTGLVVVNTAAYWTLFGKIVILVLIQLGGLGFMTIITIAMLFAHRQISLRSRIVIQASFNQDSIGGMVRLVRNVIRITLAVEAVGAIFLAIVFFFSAGMPPVLALGHGVFHSVSAFCNAGFDILGSSSLMSYQSNVPLNFIIMLLIIFGGIGFTVLAETGELVRNAQQKSLRTRIIHLSLHTKIVFVITAALIIGGALLFLLLEWNNPATLGGLSMPNKLQAALFQSVTLRTAGFNTIAQGGLTEISQAISCVFMLIGGSSASTAGGMKTVTLGVVIFSMLSVLKGRNKIEVFGRSLPLDILQKALTVASTMLIVVFLSTLLLHFTEMSNPYAHSFLDLLFESCSAAGTVGVTTGITPHLSAAGRVILAVCMYLGRISPVTMVVALNARLHAQADGISYPYERVIIG